MSNHAIITLNVICHSDDMSSNQRLQLASCKPVLLVQVQGAKDLAQGLLNNVSLHTLNLAWNGLEDAGCTAIAHTLHQNMGLQVCTRLPPHY